MLRTATTDRMHRFRKGPCQVQRDANVRTWVFARARRYVIDQHRRGIELPGEMPSETHLAFLISRANTRASLRVVR